MMLRHPKILLLCTGEQEITVLRSLLEEHAALTCASGLDDLRVLLAAGDYDALFCAWRFDGGTWGAALEESRRLHPDLPVIVFSKTAGESEWTEVLTAGAFDLP